MQYRRPELKKQLDSSHPKLIELVHWVVALADDLYEHEWEVTDVWRTLAEARRIYAAHPNQMPRGGGPHVSRPCRAVDLSLSGLTIEQQSQAAHDVNAEWVYDPQRPDMVCALIHDVGRGRHLHLQVHPRTRQRTITEGGN